MKLKSGRKYLWQWELEQRLAVPEGCTEVHFANGTSENALVVSVAEGMANIPNILLQVAASLRCYAWNGSEVIGHTMFDVLPREKPDDYVYTETEVRRYDKLLDALEKNGAFYTPVLDEEGNLTWKKSLEEMPDAPGGNIKGPKGEQGIQGPKGDPGETADDTKVGTAPWSSKNTVDKLCPTFTEKGSMAMCEPVEGYPLEVVSIINARDDLSFCDYITLRHSGKNLFSGGREISFTTSKSITPETPIPAGTYFVSVGSYTGSGEYCPALILRYEDGTDAASVSLRYYPNGKSVTLERPVTKVALYSNGYSSSSSKDVSCMLYDIQIEPGNVKTAYEEYKGVRELTADLSSNPVTEGSYNWTTGVLMDEGGNHYQHDLSTNTFRDIENEFESEGYTQPIVRNIPALAGTNCLHSDCGNTRVKGRLDIRKLLEERS